MAATGFYGIGELQQLDIHPEDVAQFLLDFSRLDGDGGHLGRECVDRFGVALGLHRAIRQLHHSRYGNGMATSREVAMQVLRAIQRSYAACSGGKEVLHEEVLGLFGYAMELAEDTAEHFTGGLISIVGIQEDILIGIAVLNEVGFDDRNDVAHGDLTIRSVVRALEHDLMLDGYGERYRSPVRGDSDVRNIA